MDSVLTVQCFQWTVFLQCSVFNGQCSYSAAFPMDSVLTLQRFQWTVFLQCSVFNAFSMDSVLTMQHFQWTVFLQCSVFNGQCSYSAVFSMDSVLTVQHFQQVLSTFMTVPPTIFCGILDVVSSLSQIIPRELSYHEKEGPGQEHSTKGVFTGHKYTKKVGPLVFRERDSQSQEASQTSKLCSDVEVSVNRKQTCTTSLSNSISSKHRPLVLLGLGCWPKLYPV
ncbi:hypothetical protein STEG23_008804 [Scotinomys teguina]